MSTSEIKQCVQLVIIKAELKKLKPKNVYVEVYKNKKCILITGCDSRGPTPFWDRRSLIDFKEEDTIELILKDQSGKIGECTIEVDDIRGPIARFNKDLKSEDGGCPGELVVDVTLKVFNKKDQKPNEKKLVEDKKVVKIKEIQPAEGIKEIESPKTEQIENYKKTEEGAVKNKRQPTDNKIQGNTKNDENVVNMLETKLKQQTEESAEERHNTEREYNKPVADKKGTEPKQSETIEDKQNDKNLKEERENYVVTEDPVVTKTHSSCSYCIYFVPFLILVMIVLLFNIY
ncbi:hypothetical protein QYM36_014188 [Artemia franciscana]|uniref:C2 domain-containing protein n=1 Tax=Artemia franciscana TaxID=6661 RepID=A0AA88L0Q2_ARTSF|nr:hypothetical protein QYM36_014188 [Artemia franciscana]